jgi:hypothetical protein
MPHHAKLLGFHGQTVLPASMLAKLLLLASLPDSIKLTRSSSSAGDVECFFCAYGLPVDARRAGSYRGDWWTTPRSLTLLE